MRRAAPLAALLVLLAAGAFLRVTHARTWPAGPWIDEAYVLRAARLAAAAHAPLFGTTALEPPEAGFVNAWVPNAYLAFVSACDRAFGGGLRAMRAVSILPALALLFAAAGLAGAAARGRAAPLLAALLVTATSTWLLTTGRWGWDVVATSALLVLAAIPAVRAAESGSHGAALAAGAFLGLAQYGSFASHLALAVPVALAAIALARRRRGDAALAGLGLAAALLVTAPLAAHGARHPERAGARAKELAVWRAPRPAAALAANVAAYARLFASGGDANERHGNPGRPVLPAAVVALSLAGFAAARRDRAALVVALFALALLAGGLLAYEKGGANAYRIAPAAPFLIVLAGIGAGALLDRMPPRARTPSAALLVATLLAGAFFEVTAFVAWASDPRTAGAFGGPERELADAIVSARRDGPAEVLLHPARAARNVYVVDVLLAPPGDPAHALRLAALAPQPEWRALPAEDVLYADADDPRIAWSVEAIGGRLVSTGRDPLGRPAWALFRIPKDAARRSAGDRYDLYPRVPPAAGEGAFLAREEGIYRIAGAGDVAATLDGRILFDPRYRPKGVAEVRLAAGRHALVERPLAPGARLAITGPDGFALVR